MNGVIYILWLNTEKSFSAYNSMKEKKLKGKERIVSKMMEGRAYDEREVTKEGTFPFGIELTFSRHIEKLLKKNIISGYKKMGCVEGLDFDLIKVKHNK